MMINYVLYYVAQQPDVHLHHQHQHEEKQKKMKGIMSEKKKKKKINYQNFSTMKFFIENDENLMKVEK